MHEFSLSKISYALMVSAALALIPMGGANAEDLTLPGLSSSEHRGVRMAGSHVLRARSSYPHMPNAETEQLRAQINATRQAIEQLLKPNPGFDPSKLTISPKLSTTENESSAWRARHAGDITHTKEKVVILRKELEERRALRQDEGDWRKQMAPGVDQRLGSLEREIDEALMLPEPMRKKRIKELVDSLEIRQSSFGRRDTSTPGAPTLSTRTAHRITSTDSATAKPEKGIQNER
jgi:hypothetical protein